MVMKLLYLVVRCKKEKSRARAQLGRLRLKGGKELTAEWRGTIPLKKGDRLSEMGGQRREKGVLFSVLGSFAEEMMYEIRLE